MQYISTRGQAPVVDFEGATLAGLARDGGLYVPESWPRLSHEDIRTLAGLPYEEVAFRVIQPFIGREIPEADLRAIIVRAYAGFSHAAVTPLTQLSHSQWLLELYHGPTLAFKDVALQLLGQFFDYFLTRRGRRITIVGATSGDTGSAAIEGCKGREAIDIFILHPAGRTSDVQRRQMTTVQAANVHNIAIEGTFDDCQALVKAMFNDLDFRDRLNLSAVNSINWARVMAQVVYYFYAGVALGAPHRHVAFSAPTGNFGDVYAGYIASQMGLPVEKLVVATNSNDILARALTKGDYSVGAVTPTISPSMDIQVSSNFERLLFDLYGRDGGAIGRKMKSLAEAGSFTIEADQLAQAKNLFWTRACSEGATRKQIKQTFQFTGKVVDPHTAVGLNAAHHFEGDVPTDTPFVTLATAHPAKFPEAVTAETGVHPALPAHLADLFSRPEKYDTLANDLAAVQAYISARAKP